MRERLKKIGKKQKKLLTVLCALIIFMALLPLTTLAATKTETPHGVNAVSASVNGPNEVHLAWDEVTHVWEYVIMRSKSPDTGFQVVDCTIDTNYTDYQLEENTTYYYIVQVLYNERYYDSAVLSVKTPKAPLEAPMNVKATGISSSQIKVDWDVVSGAVGYKVYRGDSVDGTYVEVATVVTTTLIDTNLQSETSYYYKVMAYSSSTDGIMSNPARGTTLAEPIKAVTNLAATPVSSSQIDVTWEFSNGADNYVIYRSLSENGRYEEVNTVSAGANTYQDTGLSSGTTYYYKVLAKRGSDTALAGPVDATTLMDERTIEATAGANGKISPSGTVSVYLGTDKTFTFEPDTNYAIDQVFVNNSEVAVTGNSYTFTNVQANGKIHVTFKKATVAIEATAGENGSISPSGTVGAEKGDDKTFVFTPDKNFEVDKVLVDNREVAFQNNSYTFQNIQADSKIHVTFKRTAYTIEATAGENGEISPSGDVSVDVNGEKTFTFTAKDGYKLDKVFVNDQEVAVTSNSYTFQNVQADGKIHVTFKELKQNNEENSNKDDNKNKEENQNKKEDKDNEKVTETTGVATGDNSLLALYILLLLTAGAGMVAAKKYQVKKK